MTQLNKTLEVYLVKKAPALPKGVKEFLVKAAPWLAILGVVLSIPALFAILGLSAMFYSIPMMGYGLYRVSGGFSLAVIFLVITAVLELLSIPGLMKRKMAGWNFLYYATWVNAIYSLLNYDLVGMIVGLLISLYLLFQVKSYYK